MILAQRPAPNGPGLPLQLPPIFCSDSWVVDVIPRLREASESPTLKPLLWSRKTLSEKISRCHSQFQMACLIRNAQRTLIHGLHRHDISLQSRNAISAFLFHARHCASEATAKSPFEANILRILRTEIEYQSDYAPPHQVRSCSFLNS